MSNYLAVATVTATLRRMLQAVVAADVSGATVTTVRPSGSGAGLPQTGVNAFLYQVVPNPDLRNSDLPTRRSDGSVVDRPVAALDLHYLLSFYGDESTLEPQRLLGSVVRTLHARPILSRQLIRETLADPAFGFLTSSDLADQMEVVRLSPLGFSLAELSQLWTGPLQKADYVLSVAYGASLVLLTADEKPTAALPVKERRIFVTPGRPPLVETLAAAADPSAPITLGTTLRLTGQRLRAESTQIRLSGQLFTPSVVTDTEIRFPLDSSSLDVTLLRAGTQTIQVVQPPVPPPSNEIVQPPVPPPVLPPTGVESNATTFVLRPRIVSVSLANATAAPDGTVSGTVVLKIEPPLGARQSALLLLNPAPGASAAATESALPVPARPADSADVRVPVTKVPAGRYLVRLEVDGAQSPLTSDGPLLTFGGKSR